MNKSNQLEPTGSQNPEFNPAPGDRMLLRIDDVAHLMSIGRTKVREMVATGEIASVRVGRCLRIPREALLAWLIAASTMTNTSHRAQ